MALGLGFAEELLFRGWLLDELQRITVPVWHSGWMRLYMLYCTLLSRQQRFFAPLPGFPGLLLGLTFVWAKRSHRSRLGFIGLHGLVWGYYIINVGQLVEYSGQVPDWITGVDQSDCWHHGAVFLASLRFGYVGDCKLIRIRTNQTSTSEVDARQVSTF